MKSIDLSVQYAGLSLKNPLIVSSSELTSSAEKNRIFCENGAGAIVLKSLFEEQIMTQINKEIADNPSNYPEAHDYLKNFIFNDQLQKYLTLIKESKSKCDIPIIASINCYSIRNWMDFAIEIEKAGADAIEINIMYIDTEPDFVHGKSEMMHIEILSKLKKMVKIPVIMKLSRQFTNPVSLINQLYHNGADAVVLFNRSYMPDIDLKRMTFTSGPVLSDVGSFNETFRWTGIVSGIVPQVDISASGGIHNAQEIVKAILAGAKTVQICSSIYKNGDEIIPFMITELMIWMKENGFDSVNAFRGRMNQSLVEDENFFERVQFMKYFAHKSKISPN